jgi:nucleoid-associated protein YgaU
MNKLTNKRAETFDYTSRYAGVPYYYDTVKKRDVYGIGQQIRTDTAYFTHTLTVGDTLDSLALTYYNNPTYWWAIAYFNKINDPFINLRQEFTHIKIPELSNIIFEDQHGH